MSLSDFRYLFFVILSRTALSVPVPIAMIYLMVLLKLWYWPVQFATMAVLYVIAERYSKGKPTRRRWKHWEPEKRKPWNYSDGEVR